MIDDIGLLPVAVDAAEGLYRLVDAAYEKRSVAISSNLHPSGFEWAARPRFLGHAAGGRWRLLGEWGDALAGDGLGQPNRFPGGLADVSVVQEPVDGGGRQRFGMSSSNARRTGTRPSPPQGTAAVPGRLAASSSGQFRGHQWAELVTTGGQVSWPPVRRNSWPLTYCKSTLLGDPVEVTGTKINLSPADGDLFDWAYTWPQWSNVAVKSN